MKKTQLLVILIGANILLSHVIGFNLDAKNAIRYDGPESSMFGFSVAGHRSQSDNWYVKHVIFFKCLVILARYLAPGNSL